MPTAQRTPRYKIGDWVAFTYVTRKAVAQVVEDRGCIGVKGRRLYGLRLDLGAGDLTTLELPEEELKPAHAPARLPAWSL